jgi:hypothetical protein
MSNFANSLGTTGMASGGQMLFAFAGGNNVTLSQSLNGASGTITIMGPDTFAQRTNTFGASNLGNLSGTTGVITGTALQMIIVGGNNVTISQSINASSATLTISVPNLAAGAAVGTLSWYEYPEPFAGTQTFTAQSNSHYIAPFVLPDYYSASYLRLIVSLGLVSTSFATSGVPWNTTFSQVNTLFAVIHSQNVGASSRSLASIYSGSLGWTYQVSATGAGATNNWTVTQNLTWGAEGANTQNAASNYASTLSTVNISTTGLTNFTNIRYFDVPLATQLTPGNYWLDLVRQSTTGGGKGLDWGMTLLGISQVNTPVGNIGAATNSSLQFQLGLGSWSTNVTGSTASIALANISSVSSQLRPYFQLIRQA